LQKKGGLKLTIRNCKRCGQIYHYDDIHKICPNCRKKEEEDFEKVKGYLNENPNSSINKVSKETGVAKKIIIEFIKNNRLIAEDLKIDVSIRCKRCGQEITHGKYCDQCVEKFKNELENIKEIKEDKLENSWRRKNMHLADRIKGEN